jgi:hypothetical protein
VKYGRKNFIVVQKQLQTRTRLSELLGTPYAVT